MLFCAFKMVKSFVLLQKHCKPPNEISRNFQGNNVYEFREILMTKMRNFVFKNGSTVFVIVTCVYMSLSYTGLLTPRSDSSPVAFIRAGARPEVGA